MALVVRVHLPRSAARNVIIKEPREKTMREIKEEIFISLRTLKGEANDYEAFLQMPRRILAAGLPGGGIGSGVGGPGGAGVADTEDGLLAAAVREELLSPRPPSHGSVPLPLALATDVCWVRDQEYLPINDAQKPQARVPSTWLCFIPRLLG